MKGKAVWLMVGCAFLALIYPAIHGVLRPCFFAEGRILLKLKFVAPTNEPTRTDFYDKVVQWDNHQCAAISNRLSDSERMAMLIRDSVALDEDIRFAGVYPVRSTHIIRVRFGGNEKNAAWRVTSNACVILAEFYATNRPFELQTTNPVTCEVEHIDTGFWIPTPLWRRAFDWIEGLLPR